MDNSEGIPTDVVFTECPELPMQICRVRLVNGAGHTARSDQAVIDELHVQIFYRVRRPTQSAYIMCGIANPIGEDIIFTYDGDTEQFGNRHPGFFLAEFSLPRHVLTSGRYFLRSAVIDTNHGTMHYPGIAFPFLIEDTDSLLAHRRIAWPGVVRINPQWLTTVAEPD